MNAIIETRSTKLSLAIFFIDDYTKEEPVGSLNISLKDRDYKAVKNPSGYYLFLDLPDQVYTIQVESDFYFAESMYVQLSSLTQNNPTKEIVLKPKPAYPFPNGATLVRGMVLDQTENPIPNATVEIKEKNLKTLTSEKGEYVIYFPDLKANDIIKEKGKRFVKTQNGKSIRVEATIPNDSNGKTLDSVEEGITTKAPTIELNTSC
jgi:hypothetical protein